MSFLSAPALVTALVSDGLIGYPDRLFRMAGHPVTWIGALIARLDGGLNRGSMRRAKGVLALGLLLAIVAIVALTVTALLRQWQWGWIAEGVLASSLVAQRSLHDHVRAVSLGLDQGLEAGRRAVSMIVGRDPESLDEAGVARAAIESLAENFSDGIVAPAFWLLVGGLPGIALYKAINTADSMIGHRTQRHEAFGWAAARLDDLVNLPASRLSALLIAFAAPGRIAPITAALRRDAGRHRSPNAGWPEAAMAAALGLRLAGPRRYGGSIVDDAWMGDGRAEADAGDIRRGLGIFVRACVILLLAALACVL